MNRENYDPKALSTFDIIGSYFVDIFYNDLYLKARDRVKEGRYSSITEAYKANVVNYMHGIKKKEPYMQVCRLLHEYYQRVTVYSTLTFGDFEVRILSQFIPPEYFNLFTEGDKDSNLCAIITRTVQEFGERVLAPEGLRRIIDDHSNQKNVELLQDIIVDILKIQREEYYVQFAKKINQRSGKVSEEIVVTLKAKIVEETRKRCTAEQDRDRALNIIKQLVQKISDLENDIIRMKTSTAPVTSTSHSLADDLRVDSESVGRGSTPRSRRISPRTKKRTSASTTSPKIPTPESDSESDSESSEDDAPTKMREMLAQKVAARARDKTPTPEDNIQTPEDQPTSIIDSFAQSELDDDPGFGGF